MLTRLELFLRRTALLAIVGELARRAGYSRQHFLRLRLGECDATRGGIIAVTSACRRSSGEPVKPGMLFERGDEFLKGAGQRLSRMHLDDRRKLDAVIEREPASELFRSIVATGVKTETAVRHLLKTAQQRLDTQPSAAAAIFDAAALMSEKLPRETPEELAASLRAHTLKGRANALRMVGDYDGSLALLAEAAQLYVAARYCSHEAGQVEYARAAALFKMERWDDALIATRAARKRFVKSGDARRAAHADLLAANILFEQGDSDGARATWLDLRNRLAQLKDRETLARVWLNLGVCETRRNQPDEARHWLNRASGAFRSLGNVAELARTHWNMATYLARFKSPRRAIRLLRRAQRTFLDLDMWVDAGCVGLDLTDVMLELRTPDDELSAHALLVANTLVRAGLNVSAAHALDQLRLIAEATDRRRVVRAVRAALRDAETICSEVSVAGIGETGTSPPAPPAADA